jgi:predicted nuclease of predicted toxin-antitoxin system
MSSRKRSITRPDGLVFFVDRSLGRKPLISRLQQLGWTVHAHDELFEPSAADTEWLAYCGHHNLVILTKDERIRYRPAEKAMLIEHKCRCFVLTAGGVSGRQIADIFDRAAHKIVQVARQEAAPFLAYIDSRGRITLSHRELRRPPR